MPALYYLDSYTVGKWFIIVADLVDVTVVEQFGPNPENDFWATSFMYKNK